MTTTRISTTSTYRPCIIISTYTDYATLNSTTDGYAGYTSNSNTNWWTGMKFTKNIEYTSSFISSTSVWDQITYTYSNNTIPILINSISTSSIYDRMILRRGFTYSSWTLQNNYTSSSTWVSSFIDQRGYTYSMDRKSIGGNFKLTYSYGPYTNSTTHDLSYYGSNTSNLTSWITRNNTTTIYYKGSHTYSTWNASSTGTVTETSWFNTFVDYSMYADTNITIPTSVNNLNTTFNMKNLNYTRNITSLYHNNYSVRPNKSAFWDAQTLQIDVQYSSNFSWGYLGTISVSTIYIGFVTSYDTLNFLTDYDTYNRSTTVQTITTLTSTLT
jgi:hypothetical protein